MKKLLFSAATILSLCAAQTEVAQAQAFKKDDNIVSIGYGFPNLTRSLFNTYKDKSSYDFSGVGPLHFKFEHGVTDYIGIGVSVNAVSNKITFKDGLYNYDTKYNSLKFNARFNYHFNGSDDFDPYIGMGVGYGSSKTTSTSNEPNYDGIEINNPLPIGLEATAGCRYFFSDNIGVYGEIGLAKSIMQVGMSFKF